MKYNVVGQDSISRIYGTIESDLFLEHAHARFEKVEEWVDVTQECAAKLRTTEDGFLYIDIVHGRLIVLTGREGRFHPHPFNRNIYKVSFNVIHSDQFKVEKRV
jgi:hypothetical protein